MPSVTHYEVLGVSRGAESAVIRRAYVTLARRYHPDYFTTAGQEERSRAEAMMRRINEAWQVLSDPHQRAVYDLSLPAPAAAGPQPRPRTPPPPHAPPPAPGGRAYSAPGPAGASPRPLRRRLLVLAPPAFVLAAVACAAVGLVAGGPFLGVALLCLAAALLLFVLAPLVALSEGRRSERARRRARTRA